MSPTLDYARCAKGFERHGTGPLHIAGGQGVGRCPFHLQGQRSRCFYVSVKELTWDCKVCAEKGNWYTFLRKIADANAKQLTGSVLNRLAVDRDLPPAAFKGLGIGWDGAQYTIPIEAKRSDDSGWFVCDIRTKQLGEKMLATPGARIGLWNHKAVVEADPRLPVYLCEGEWDGIAMRWLLLQAKKPGIVCAVPGASAFKEEWLDALQGRMVRSCYDADGPGEKGELKAAGFLAGVALKVEFLHWPPDVPTGFDVRDWVSHGLNDDKDVLGCYNELHKLFRPQPRQPDPTTLAALGVSVQASGRGLKRAGATVPATGSGGSSRSGASSTGKKKGAKPPVIKHSVLYDAYRKWMHMHTEDPIAVIFGTVLANKLIDGDPLWLFTVAPPGGMKSELLMSLSSHPDVYSVSTLSAASLCSGMVLPGNVDPSLLPKLDGKVLVVKDFTTTLTANPHERDEILGTLRDAYDGKFEKQFGNMPRPRRYETRFGILAGVTPTIDSYQSVSARLGERFMKFRFERDIDELDEEQRIRRAMSNVGSQTKMRDALREQAAQFLESRLAHWEKKEPRISAEISDLIVPLAVFTAKLRGQVDRDAYRPELMKSRASREFGTRLSKQLVLLAKGIAIYFGISDVDMDVYRLVAIVALGSVPDKTEEVLRALWFSSNAGTGRVSASDVARRCRGVSPSTVMRELQDQRMLEIVDREGEGTTATWRVNQKFKKLIERSRVFEMAVAPISLRKKRIVRRR